MSEDYPYRRRTGTVRADLGLLLLWWGWMPALGAVWWLFVTQAIGGIGTWQRSYGMWLDRNVLLPGGWFYLWLTIGLIGTAVIVLRDDTTTGRNLVAIGAVVGALILFVHLWMLVWDSDKDAGRYGSSRTTFFATDLHDPPPSLVHLFDGARSATTGTAAGRCDLTGGADVASCIRRGALPQDGWQPRVSSSDGARIVMSRTSGDQQNVNLDTETITYLNARDGKPPQWTGVLDGRGYSTGAEGVVEWDGTHNPTECHFGGTDDRLQRAFHGGRGNSLPNIIAEAYPRYVHSMEDVWGYCDRADRPVLVVPMQKQIPYNGRTVMTAAGVLEIRGSASGLPRLTYRPAVRAGDLAGPVYSASLVDEQLRASDWAAGRKWKNRAHFGFEAASSTAQAGNTADYLLENSRTHRLEWVTPLILKSSTSELFIAYAVSPADQVRSGQLNPLNIYVLGEQDRRRINIDNLEAAGRNYVADQDPGFFSAHGKLIEYTPVDGQTWRAFGELNGRVVYRLDISTDVSVRPNLVRLNSYGAPPAGGGSGGTRGSPGSECGGDLSRLSRQDLVDCITRFSQELAHR